MSKPTINARIRIGRVGDALTFAWEGDNIVGITMELLQDADRRYCTYVEFPDTPGLRFTFGPYLLEVVECDFPQDCILAKRIWV